MKTGDRVTKTNVWKLETAYGTITKVKEEYIIIEWDNVFGEWYYTSEQAKKIEVVSE